MKKLTVSEIASISGVSVRTLHYYDEIGLLPPQEINESGYRFYGEPELMRLQQILFFRELGFRLIEIKNILAKPDYDKTAAIKKQQELLQLKRQHIDSLLKLIDETIGGIVMSKLEITIKDIEQYKETYADEVKSRWGNTTAYKEFKDKNVEKTEELAAAKKAEEIFSAFAQIRDTPADSPSAQELVAAWQDHITINYYNCTKEVLSCLGEMYVEDERFLENIDRHGKGTAEYIREAIRKYCSI